MHYDAMLARAARWRGFFVPAFLWLSLAGSLGAAQLQNLNVPATAVRGATITVSFQMKGPAWGKANYAVSLSSPGAFACGPSNVWVANEKGVFGPESGQPVLNCPDPIGPQGGIAGDSALATPAWVTYVFRLRIPDDAPTPLQVNVIANDWSVQSTPQTCIYSATLNSSLSIAGVRQGPRLDMQIFRSGSEATQYKLAVRVLNHGSWPVNVGDLCVRYWFNDAYGTWIPENYGNNQSVFFPDGQFVSNVPALDTQVTAMGALDCGGDRKANWLAQTCFAPSGALPGCGSYLSTADGNSLAVWHRGDWADIDFTDDYSRMSDGGGSAATATDSRYVLLTYNGQDQCEQKADGQNDPNAGSPPCNSNSACGPALSPTPSISPTSTPSPSATRSSTATNSPTPVATSSVTPSITPSPSPTVSGTMTSTPYPTPIAADCAWNVRYQAGDTGSSVTQARPWFEIRNTSTVSQDLAALSIEYWFHVDGSNVDTLVESAEILGQTGQVQDRVLLSASGACASGQGGRMKMAFHPYLLSPGAVLRVQTRFWQRNGAAILQNLDHSFNPSGEPGESAQLPVLCHGFIIAGARPVPNNGLPVDPDAQSFNCLLWQIQERMDRVVSAVVDVQRDSFTLPLLSPEPTILASPTPVIYQTVFLKVPHYVRAVSRADGHSKEMIYVRNDESISLEIGGEKGEYALSDCEPSRRRRMPDWIAPKQVTKPYDYFGRFNFVFQSSNGSTATWMASEPRGTRVYITVDLSRGLIIGEEFWLKADGSERDLIEGLVYDTAGAAPLLTAARIRSLEADGRATVFDFAYAYQQTGTVLPLELFR